MSYDFLMMKPSALIRSPEEVSEETLALQDPQAIVAALERFSPQIAWRRTPDGGWSGSLDGEDTWYEFRIGESPDYTWSICTSHRTDTRSLIPAICDALGVVAFDGQAGTMIVGTSD
ncbi:MAG: hypothetical protein U1E21_20290 [Reyranellaceae bacterium]